MLLDDVNAKSIISPIVNHGVSVLCQYFDARKMKPVEVQMHAKEEIKPSKIVNEGS